MPYEPSGCDRRWQPFSGVPIDAIFVGLTSIIVIRTILEMLLEALHSLSPVPDFYWTAVIYAHVTISWLCLFQAFALAMALFLQLSLAQALRLVLLFAPLTLIVPLWDYASSGGAMTVYGIDFSDFFSNYGNVLNPLAQVTMVSGGVRVEVFLATAGSFLLSLLCFKKGLLRSLGLAGTLYTIVFFFGYLPALARAVGFNPGAFGAEGSVLSSYQSFFFLYLPVTAALIVLTIARLWRESSGYGRAALDLVYPSRLLFYLLLLVFGMFFAAQQSGLASTRPETSDAVRLLLAAMSIVLLFVYAKLRNDLADLEIDRVCNPDRPIVRGVIPAGDAAALGRVLLPLSFVFALPANPGFTLLWFLLAALSEIYSEEPLRLRRYYPLGHVVLALIGTTVFLGGATLISAFEFFRLKGVPGMCGLVFSAFFLLSHLKDFKDREGDKLAGVANVFNWTTHPRWIGAAAVCLFATVLVLIVHALFAAPPAAAFIAIAGYLAVSLAAIVRVRDIRALDGLLMVAFALLLVIAALWLLPWGG